MDVIPCLQELIVNVIIKNIELFAKIDHATKDSYLKKHLLFLKKVYTPALFYKVLKRGISAKVIKFIMNRYVKEVDIYILMEVITQKETIKRIRSIAKNLETISAIKEDSPPTYDFMCSRYLETLMHVVPVAPMLIKIIIPGLCDDVLLELIAANCIKLQELNISGSRNVTGNGLRVFSKIRTEWSLSILRLSGMQVSCEDIEFLLEFITSLQVIDYDQLPYVIYYIHHEDVDGNAEKKVKTYNLIKLNFSLLAQPSILTSCLAVCCKLCPLVRNLVVHITKWEELEACCNFLQLEDLNIKGSIDINQFLSMMRSKLKTLTVISCAFCMSSLIINCSKLESLVLENVKFGRPSDSNLYPLPHLKNLQLEITNLSESYCLESITLLLNSSPNLENLLFHCNFMDSEMSDFISTFQSKRNLKNLKFLSSDVNFCLLQQIVLNCNSLEKLSICDCENIHSEDINVLKHTFSVSNKTIKIIFYEYQSVSDMYEDDIQYWEEVEIQDD